MVESLKLFLNLKQNNFFNLLSYNINIMAWRYKQVTGERDLCSVNFPNGEVKYLHRMPAKQQINLDRSFIRLRCKLSKADLTQLQKSDNIAPNYLMAYGLFKQMYHFINGVKVGEVESYVQQVGALMHRISYPQSYKDGFLASTNFAKISYLDRQQDVVSSGLSLGRSGNLLTLDNYGYLIGAAPVANRHTYQLVTAANRIIFAAVGAIAPPDCRTLYELGDQIQYVQNDGTIAVQEIVEIEDALNIIVTNVTANAAARDILNDVRLIKRKERASGTTQEFEIVFKPPMGIWNKDVWLPAHDMSTVLYPHPDQTYQKNVIQSVGTNKVHNTDFNFEVLDMIMYVCIRDQRHEDGEYSYNYEDMRMQLSNITNTSNIDNHFIVDRQAHSFTLAFQDENVQNNTLFSGSQFKIRNNEELKLERYWMKYNGVTLPNPYPQISKTPSKDLYTQRYYETAMYSGANSHYDIESKLDWESAGPYYTHRFGKSRYQTEKVSISTLFEENAFENNHRPNLLLFDHFTRHYKLKVSGGRVQEVSADKVN